MKKTFLFIALAALLPLVGCQKKAQPAAEQTPMEFAMSMGMGWNLGNNMDAHRDGVAREDGFGNLPATEAVFETIAKAGIKTVRIPCTWMNHIGDAPEYKIDEARMERVAELVGFAKKHGLKAIVNIHHDGFGADPDKNPCYWLDVEGASLDSAKNEAIKAKLYAVWYQIATRFADEGEWLIFETMNEIQDGLWGNGTNRTDGGAQYRTLDEWNQVCVNAIRAAGGENTHRYIGIPSYVTQPYMAVEHLTLPEDQVEGRLMVAVHSYDPWDYAGSGKYSEWGHTGKDVVSATADEAEYVQMLKALYDKFVANGIPVYFGEFGCVHRADAHAEAFRKYYIEYVCKAMREYQMTGCWWDNSYHMVGDDAFGLVEHSDGTFIDNGEEILHLMVSAWENDDPEYTLESIYARAPEAL